MIEYKTINKNSFNLYTMTTLKNGNEVFYFDDLKGLIAYGFIDYDNTAHITINNQCGYIDRFKAIKKDLKRWCNCSYFDFKETDNTNRLGTINISVINE